MKLLGNTKELIIKTENCHREDTSYEVSGIKYPLYEANYISGIRMIFQQTIERDKWLKENNERFLVNEKRNILSFVGKRGAGKTTAMDEFCRILSKMQEKETKKWWLEHTLNSNEQEMLRDKDFMFHILSPIDASLLEEKEDLFELILASIYRKFEKTIKSNVVYGFEDNLKVQDIMKKFSEIFKMYQNTIRRGMEEEYGNVMISKMQFMVGSQEIQKKVAELIDELLSIEKKADVYEYIVVVIDDLDLNLRHAYEMLVQLQKYFSYYKIIVLITMDYEQMQLDCEEHFRKEMPYTTAARSEMPCTIAAYSYLSSEHNEILANDCMIKMFHLSQRMYMPDICKIASKTKIIVPKEISESEEIAVKMFIITKVAEAMRIFYDGCGLKNHFSEPQTIRNLVAYNEFLESLNIINYECLTSYEELVNDEKTIKKNEAIIKEYEQIEEKNEANVKKYEKAKQENEEIIKKYEKAKQENEEIIKKYDQNHERFIQDINIRMAQNITIPSQKKAFEQLSERGLERRARYFVNAYRVEKAIKFNAITEDTYTYGKLLQTIYEWGRNKKNGGDYFEDKPFIRCILASFTSEMVCQYLKYRYNPDPVRRQKYRKRLLGFFGETFGNEWIGQAFPMVNLRINEIGGESRGNLPKRMSCGYVREINQGNLNIAISLEGLKKKYQQGNKKNDNVIEKTISTWLDEQEIIETLECIDMFFIRKEGDDFKGIQYEFKIEMATESDRRNYTNSLGANHNVDAPKGKQQQSLIISGMGEVQLDVMAFVAKSMDYNKTKENLESNILEGLKACLGKYLNLDDAKMNILENVIKQKIDEKSLFNKYIDEKNFEYEVAFPFYNLDMSYNIFKRVREHFKNKIVNEEDLFGEIVSFYQYIEEVLGNQQKEYLKTVEFKYLSIFQNCPYIKAIYDLNKKQTSKVPERIYAAFYSMGVMEENEAEK